MAMFNSGGLGNNGSMFNRSRAQNYSSNSGVNNSLQSKSSSDPYQDSLDNLAKVMGRGGNPVSESAGQPRVTTGVTDSQAAANDTTHLLKQEADRNKFWADQKTQANTNRDAFQALAPTNLGSVTPMGFSEGSSLSLGDSSNQGMFEGLESSSFDTEL